MDRVAVVEGNPHAYLEGARPAAEAVLVTEETIFAALSEVAA